MVKVAACLVAALAFASDAANASCARGLAWGANWDFAPNLGKLPMISWYHSWGVGPVTSMPSKVEFIPMFWGPARWGQWNTILGKLKGKPAPKHMFSFNEPDISTQSNMDATYAAQLFKEQISPWRAKGTKVGSPAIVWKLTWLKDFLAALKKKGGDVDMICLHWYGSYQDLAGLKKYIASARALAPTKPIWMLEIGVTIKSNPSQYQAKQFMMEALAWMDTQPYIERAAWYGVFEPSKLTENFASRKNALLKDGGAVSDLGMWYGWTAKPDKRSLRTSDRRDIETNSTIVAEHCDSICQLRNEQVALVAAGL